jgi:signal transduction histidine kinase/CheY-like chemotaxis protein
MDRWWHHMRRFRVRLGAFLVGGILVTAVTFYALLLTVTRVWLERELSMRSLGITREIVRGVAAPILAGDPARVRDEIQSVLHEEDVVAVTVYDLDGSVIARFVRQPLLWRDTSWTAPRMTLEAGPMWSREPAGDFELRSVALAVDPERYAHGPPPAVADGPPYPGSGGAGTVQLVVSTQRLEHSMSFVSRLGLALLALALALALAGAWSLIRLVTRPLREASDLARAIANGQLDRRLPVRSDDELGRLAESMNAMAGALSDSRRRESQEADRLGDTAEAMVRVAQTARGTDDPAAVFRIVAEQVQRITGCNGVALTMADETRRALVFRHFDPAPPWGGLDAGMTLEPETAERFWEPTPPLIRLTLRSPVDDLSGRLARAGFRSALLVPLAVARAAPAALLLVSRQGEAFSNAEIQVITGLTSHLSAALHAQQLSHRLEEAFTELQATQDQLVRAEKLRATGELAAGVAHDFNNVLGAILGRLQLLQRRLVRRELVDQELSDSLVTMELAAHDGAETVRRLRQFGSGDAPESEGPVDLSEAMSAAAAFTRTRWRDEAESAGREVRLELRCETGVWVRGRASELREVFTNLILNALDALPEGGSIVLSARVEGDEAVGIIEDDGVGMSPEVLGRVFDPFFTTKGARGTGLGLSIVYGIVRRMQGHLAVESDPGDGTRVEMRFPLAAPPVAVPGGAPPRSEPPAVTRQLQVLVVDDEPDVCGLVADICQSLGHCTMVCASGAEALEAYGTGGFDIVLSDLGMPGMTGWDLVRALRERDAAIPIVLVTGWGDTVEESFARKAGVDLVIAKPFTIDDIARALALTQQRDRRVA